MRVRISPTSNERPGDSPMPRGSVRVTTFPTSDVAFRAHVDTALDRLGRCRPPDLELQIRAAYPGAIVRVRTAMAEMWPSVDTETWYAYRDGTVRPADDAEWWLDESLPRTLVAADGSYIDANDAAADLFGVPRDEILAAKAGAFTRHEGSDDVGRRLFQVLAETGGLDSTAVVLRRDGEEWPIAFHMSQATEPDRYITVMRRT
jgi:PAS domain-containing protein